MNRSYLDALSIDERRRYDVVAVARGNSSHGPTNGSNRISGGRQRRNGREKRIAEPPLYPSISMIYDIQVINVEQLFYDLDRKKKLQPKRSFRCENISKLESDYYKTPPTRRPFSNSSCCSSSLGSSSQGNQLDTGSVTVESTGYMGSAFYNASQSRGSSVSSSSQGRRTSVGSYYQRNSLPFKSVARDFNVVDPVGEDKPFKQQQEYQYGRKDHWYDSKMVGSSEKSDYSSQSYEGKVSGYGVPLKSEKVYYEPEAPTPSDPLEVEVFPGVFMMLRGSEETWQAVQANHICKASCICCGSSLYCIRDADFVLCPDCRAISPVYSGPDEKNMRDAKRASGGVGLGFTPQDLVNWQSEPYFAC